MLTINNLIKTINITKLINRILNDEIFQNFIILSNQIFIKIIKTIKTLIIQIAIIKTIKILIIINKIIRIKLIINKIIKTSSKT